jgi:hypothetical protein
MMPPNRRSNSARICAFSLAVICLTECRMDAGPTVGPMELRASRRRDGRIDRGALRGQSFIEKCLIAIVQGPSPEKRIIKGRPFEVGFDCSYQRLPEGAS